MGSLALADDQPALAANSLFYQSVYPSSAPTVESADGLYFTLKNGQRILDSTGGAAVSAIGHGNERVKSAIIKQLNKFTYAHPGYFQNDPSHELAEILVRSTGGQLSRACLLGSGSEAVEAAMKLARQYFLELDPKAPGRGSSQGRAPGTDALWELWR
ncbi:class III aminotransferase [Colletotrichum tofieldiae]|nr:class III aminotransferase [Colletotrichum tofieldiae]